MLLVGTSGVAGPVNTGRLFCNSGIFGSEGPTGRRFGMTGAPELTGDPGSMVSGRPFGPPLGTRGKLVFWYGPCIVAEG